MVGRKRTKDTPLSNRYSDLLEKINKAIKDKGLEIEEGMNRNRMVDSMWKYVRSSISGPAFLIDHPVFVSPLAKSKEEEQNLTERFQVIIAGSGFNGINRDNKVEDYNKRFIIQIIPKINRPKAKKQAE